MPNISNINGLTLCDETNVNGVVIANISNIDNIDKSCVVCNSITLCYVVEGGCTAACNGEGCEECGTFYVNAAANCPLEETDTLYQVDGCSDGDEVENGYFSPQPCGGEECGYCYTVGGGDAGVISAVAACR